MKRVYLSPSNQVSNVGKYKKYNLNECTSCTRIAEKARAFLLDNYDVDVRIAEQKDNMNVRGEQSNEWGSDAYISIHSNAATATAHGTEVHIKTKDDKTSLDLANALLKPVSTIFGTSRGIKVSPSLIECNVPTCPHCLIELGFHTNENDTKALAERYEEIGIAIGQAIADFTQAEKKPTESESEEAEIPAPTNKDTEKEYCVAFDKASAERITEALKALGFKSIYKEI